MSLASRQNATFEKLSDFVLRTEPLWPVPLYILLVYNSPYFWAGWIIALLPWSLRLWRKGYLLPRTLFDIPILIFMIGAILGVIYSDHRLLSIEAFQSYLCVILFYYAVADGDWWRHWKIWGSIFTVFVLLVSIFVLSQAPPDTSNTIIMSINNWFIEMLPTMPNIFDFTANINGLAILLDIIIAILFGIAILGVKLHRRIRISASVLALMFLFLLAITNSRGGWIATGVALFVILVWRTKWALMILPVVAGIMLWVWQAGYDPLNMLHLTSSNDIHRIQIWQATVQMFKDYPVWGCGLGVFPLVFLPYAQSNLSFSASNPHNAYLMLYSDTGILGAAAVVLALVILTITIVKLWRAPGKQPAHIIAIGIIASLIALGIHSVFEASSAAIWTDGSDNYRYLASFLPWFAAGCLAGVMKKLKTMHQAL